MAGDPIREIIAAFAAGCIDKDNFAQFKDYLNAGGELPEGELGELQNIVAMIPVILDLEQPDPSIKDSIAKKLIGMQDEIKTRIREEKKKTLQTFEQSPTFNEIKTIAGKTFLKEPFSGTKTTKQFTKPERTTKISEQELLVNDSEEQRSKETNRMENSIPEQPQSLFTHSQQPLPPVVEEKSSSGFAGWMAVILALLFFTILGYYTYTSIDELNNRVETLERDVTSLRSDLATSNNFVSNYISLIEFFNNRDVTVVNLTSFDPNEKSSARLLLAFDQKEGLIQFKNTKPLQPNQGFQVWVVSKNQSYSLGVYSPNGSEYMRLTAFPFLPKEQIERIRITIESNTGSPTPSVQSYLEGSLFIRR